MIKICSSFFIFLFALVPIFGFSYVFDDKLGIPEEALIVESIETERNIYPEQESVDGFHQKCWWELRIGYTLKLEDDSTLNLLVRFRDRSTWHNHNPISENLLNLKNTFYIDQGDLLKISLPTYHYEWMQGWGRLIHFTLFREEIPIGDYSGFALFMPHPRVAHHGI